MAIRPFWHSDTVVLTSNGSGSFRFDIGAGEKGVFKRIMFKSTGAFSITGFRDSSGLQFSNVNSSEPIPSTMLKTGVTDIEQVQYLVPDLEIIGPAALLIDILDTSAAGNTCRCVIEGSKEFGGG